MSATETTDTPSDVLVSRRVVLWGPIVTGLVVAALGSGTSLWMNSQSIHGQVTAENQTHAREAYLDFHDKVTNFIFPWRYSELAASLDSPTVDELLSSFSKVSIYGSVEVTNRANDVLSEISKAVKAGVLTDENLVFDWKPTDDALTRYEQATRQALSISN